MTKELPWHQRLKNFKKALDLLTRIVDQLKNHGKTEIIELASLLSFTQNFTLAIDCMIKFFTYQGDVYLEPGKMIIRLAFRRGLIEDGEIWMDMLKTDEQEKMIYEKSAIEKTSAKIIEVFYPVFLKLYQALEKRKLRDEEE